jgi:acetyl esterase
LITSEHLLDKKLLAFVDEQRIANKKIRAAGATLPGVGDLSTEQIRKFRLYHQDGSFKPKLVEHAYDDSIVAGSRSLPIRVFPVAQPLGIYLHFHGGGFTLGSIHEQDSLLWECACETQLTVITVGYPLAPESLLPNTLDVTALAAQAVMDRYPDMAFCFGGESAGANVMLNTLLRLSKNTELASRIKAINACYGLFDLSMTPSQRSWGDEFINLSTPFLEWFSSLCMPGSTSEERRDPLVSPLYADLRGLPPTIFSVGALDPLLDDSLFMSTKWFSAGNEGELRIYPEAPHGFNGLPTQMGMACNKQIYKFLNQHVT